MTVKDGRGFSPDGGEFTAKNNVIYWDKGGVTDLNKEEMVNIRFTSELIIDPKTGKLIQEAY